MSNPKTPDWEEAGKEQPALKAAQPESVAVSKEEVSFLDPDGLLSPSEIADIKAKARAELMDVKKSNLRREILDKEKARLKNEEGLTTGNGHQDEMVSITIELPSFSAFININGVCYYHGRTYSVPRHVANTLRDQMNLSWRHQNQIDGKSLTDFYAQKHVADLYKVSGGATLSGKAA